MQRTPLLSTSAAMPGAADRRARARHPSRQHCLARPHGQAAAVSWPARLRNISCRGIALLLPWQFQPGVVLDIVPLGWRWPRPLLARVTYAEAAGKDWLHGCELLAPLSEDELRFWLT